MCNKKIVVSILCLISAFCIIIFFYIFNNNKDSSINKGKIVISGNELINEYPKEEIIKLSDTVVLGEVIKKLSSKYTNPDRKIINQKTGENILNSLATDYLIKIDKIYKGMPYDQEFITVRTYNRLGIVLTNEQDVSYESEQEEFYLNIGDKTILCLAVEENTALYTGELCYTVVGGAQGYFIQKDSLNIYAASMTEINLDYINDDLKAAVNYKSDLYNYTIKQLVEYDKKVKAYAESKGKSTE